MMGWGDGRRNGQREAGEAAAAADTVGNDEAQGRRQHATRLGLELVGCDALARSRIEAREDDPRVMVYKDDSRRRRRVAAARGKLRATGVGSVA